MDQLNSLPLVAITPLLRIENIKGDIFHGIRASDPGYAGFGEAYFTSVFFGETKGWKKHTKMTMNLIVPQGMVRFHIHCEASCETTVYDIGDINYCRLTVPPGYWVAFKGLTVDRSLILNISSIEHDPTEAINAPLHNFSLLAS